MYPLFVNNLKEGMRTGRPIYDEVGDLLLNQGMALTDRYIRRLREKGFTYIYIEDADTADINIQETLDERIRNSAIKRLRDSYDLTSQLTPDVKGESAAKVKKTLRDPDFRKNFNAQFPWQAVMSEVDQIMDDVLRHDILTGVTFVKSYSDYVYQHTIDTTVAAVMLGKKVGLDHQKQKDLAIGCMLHDIGYLFIDEELLDKQEELTDAELETIYDHAALGYELLRGSPRIGIIPPHIAYQHHENQDGTGYPRCLTGTNKIEEHHEQGHILGLAEICAVADVYDALSSPRSFRPAFPPDKVVGEMRRMAGTRLNRSLVWLFLEMIPVFPLGSMVRVTNGQYQNHFGIICRIDREKLDKPVVRVLLDRFKNKIKPIELDLKKEPELTIQSII
jgi:HD-GYP domain-containing protein (c-di-GMP phosphodiesterase class II)